MARSAFRVWPAPRPAAHAAAQKEDARVARVEAAAERATEAEAAATAKAAKPPKAKKESRRSG